MLLEAKNSEDFLAEALAIATLTYIINKSLSISINLNTSEEIWRGTPPTYQTYVHILSKVG